MQSAASGPFPLNVWRSQRILLSRNAVMSPRSYHSTIGDNSHYVKDSPHLGNQVAFNSWTASVSPWLRYTTSGRRHNTGRFRITSYFVVITINLLHETTRMTKITTGREIWGSHSGAGARFNLKLRHPRCVYNKKIKGKVCQTQLLISKITTCFGLLRGHHQVTDLEIVVGVRRMLRSHHQA